MTRNELFEKFYKKNGYLFSTKADAKDGFDGVFDTMLEQIAAGNDLTITGFGKFRRTVLAAREVKNPRTKQITMSPEHTVVRFTPGRPLAIAVK